MAIDFKTTAMAWSGLANHWYNRVSDINTSLGTMCTEAEKAVNLVTSNLEVGRLAMPSSKSQLDLLNVNRRKIVSFCNGIHYEIYQEIDNPFATRMSEVAGAAYDLNPSDIRTSWKVMGGISIPKPSLTDMIKVTIFDPSLRADFEEKYRALDADRPSGTLSDAITEARFWQKEFDKSEEIARVADRIFTDQVRKDWSTMTENERKAVLEQYVSECSTVMGEGTQIVTKLEYNAGGYGVSYGNGTIAINPAFVTDPEGNYALDKVIDTLTHETRHQFQQEVRSDPAKFGVSPSLQAEWELPYVSSSVDYEGYFNQEVERDARGFAAVSSPTP